METYFAYFVVALGVRREGGNTMARKEVVTKVIDGDTFKTASRTRPVRLANVDTPEKGQPGSAIARRALEKKILGKPVFIDTVARDKYNRAVANVKAGSKSINKAMRRYEK